MHVATTGSEIDQLLAFVAEQRWAIRVTAHGLTDEQARRPASAGTLTVGGLIKHTIATEESWLATARHQPWSFEAGMARHQSDFTFGEDETLAGLFTEQDRVAREMETFVREIGDLDYRIPVPKDVPWFPQDWQEWDLRWVLMHLIEEIGRHAGHADIVRESVDGATNFPLVAAFEGWPATPWLTPWTPADAPTS